MGGTAAQAGTQRTARRLRRRTIGAVAAGFALSAIAFAGPAAADLYPTPNPPSVAPSNNATVQGATKTAPSGSLPFTGGDVAGLAGIGAALVAGGYVMHRRSRAHA